MNDHLQLFREEAVDLLAELEASILELESGDGTTDTVNALFRSLHTIKGCANMLGIEDVGAFAHALETIYAEVRDGKQQTNKLLLDQTLQAKDILAIYIDNPEKGFDDSRAQAILASLENVFAQGDTIGVEDAPAPAAPSGPAPIPEHVAFFMQEAPELFDDLRTAVADLEASPSALDSYHTLFRALHTIQGSCDLFGVEDVAAFTECLEEPIRVIHEGAAIPGEAIVAPIKRAMELYEAYLSDPGAGIDYTATNDIVEALDAVATAPATSDSAASQVAETQPEEIATEDDSSPAAPLSYYKVTLKPNGTPSYNLAPEALLREAAALGTGKIFADGLELTSELDDESDHQEWILFLETTEHENAVQDIFIFVDAPAEVAIEVVSEKIFTSPVVPAPVETVFENEPEPAVEEAEISIEEPATESTEDDAFNADSLEEALPEIPAETLEQEIQEASAVFEPKIEEPAAPVIEDPAPEIQISDEAQDTQPSAVENQTQPQQTPDSSFVVPQETTGDGVRVDASKLDTMVDLVGELVIAQVRLNQIAQDVENHHLKNVSEEIERLCVELREQTLGLRMLPIGLSFIRFRRMVREIAQEQNKAIDLTTIGGETELDKNVIERLGEPLVHLLRNCIEHGIETVDTRRELGKPTTGNITLAAKQAGGMVHIVIQDDGYGLDRDAILAKGIERGIVSINSRLSDREVFDLIFHPGFSTLEQSTTMSGENAEGMDAVKKSIEALKGTIDIKTDYGKGTTFTIKLPLTLAIIEGLQVMVGDEHFIIPLSDVEECVELQLKDNERERLSGLLGIRGEQIPYVQLRQWFGVPGESPEILHVVVVGHNDRQTGIVVDQIEGQRQTVIKNLGATIGEIEGVSGATVMGDGSMALIVDVPTLLSATEASVL